MYVYDDGTTDPGVDSSSVIYRVPSDEQLSLGRLAPLQEWVNNGDGTATMTDFTDTQYGPVTGQASSITSNEGTINYTYDPATGNKVRMWTGTDSDNAPDDTAYAYNALGELIDVYTLVLDGTRYATYTGISLSSHNPTFTGTPLTVAYTYDAVGNLKTESQPDDTTTTYTYDDENRLTDLSTVNTSSNPSTNVFTEQYVLNPDGTKASATETELQPDGTTATINTTWTYDAEDRLIGESIDSSLAGHSQSETWTYDLDGNRITQVVVASGSTHTTASSYNTDGELTQTVDTTNGTTTYTYDADGNQQTVTNGSSVTTDGYDLRGRLISVTSNGSTTTYTYDTDGNRTSETTGGTTTFYLNDPNNPTGYAKPVEQWVSTDGSRDDATLGTSYIIGMNVVAQASGGGTVSYLLADGGGSTRALLNSSGVITAMFSYDAFGDAIGFNPSTAGTIFLYGGDGMYDAPSGLYFHGSGRQSDNANDDFIESDAPGYGSNASPLSLNLYLLDNANAVNITDPSGHDGLVGTLGVLGILGVLGTIGFSTNIANAPEIGGAIYHDTSGSLVLGAAGTVLGTYIIGAIVTPIIGQGVTLARGVIQNVAASARFQSASALIGSTGQLDASAGNALAELEGGNPGAHFLARHGPDVTLDQLYTRATIGLTPDGMLGNPSNASAFLSNQAQYAAAQRAIQIYTAAPETAISFNMNTVVGDGFLRGGGQYVVTSNVQAIFRNGRLYTLYPLLQTLP